MSEVTEPNSNPLGHLVNTHEGSKIEEYGLADKVRDLWLQGFKPSRIAKECNKILEARKDNVQYVAINHVNVSYSLKSEVKANELAPPNVTTPLAQKSIDITARLENTVNIIDTEIEKLRNIDSPVAFTNAEFFTELVKQLLEALKLAASVQGKMQPSITFNVFQNNIEKFCQVIENTSQFDDTTKGKILQIVAETLLTQDVLKPTKGKEIKDEK